LRKDIERRTLRTADYILENKATVRQAAKEMNVSRSTVHRDITIRLKEINPFLAKKIRELLNFHKDVRHIRGGNATKEKYMN
jgi:putative DeoR family transcriptional regulator (stage III sporulation protein D)